MLLLPLSCLALRLGEFLGGFPLLLDSPFLALLCCFPGLLRAIRTGVDLGVSRSQPRETYQDKYQSRNSFHSAPKAKLHPAYGPAK